MNLIEAHNISKSFNKQSVKAVDNVSFSIKAGEIYGLIGPDGAGKSTIFRMLTTLLLPDSGIAIIDNRDVVKNYAEIRKIIGYVPGRFSLYSDLSIYENLSFFASIFNVKIEDNYHLIKDIYEQIKPFKDRKAGALSGGMKQKLALCCALIHKPKALFLDEPTTGIDPVSRIELWSMLKNLKKDNIAIMASTPYMDEAMQCDRIALIQNGKIMSTNNPIELMKQYNRPLFAIKANNMFSLLNLLSKNKKVSNSYAFGESAHVIYEGEIEDLKQYLISEGCDNVDIKQATPTIEDCFIEKSIE